MNEKKETEQVSGENVPETPQLPPKKTKESFLPEGSAKEKFFYIVKTAILIAVSAFLLAFSSYCLIAPNDFAIGGVTGIAIILGKKPRAAGFRRVFRYSSSTFPFSCLPFSW